MSSGRKEKFLSLAALEYDGKSVRELKKLSKEVLNNGMHGLCFSTYGEGQKPGDQITEAQIRRRMEIIKPYTQWIRSFSCTDGNELIPKIAKEYGVVFKLTDDVAEIYNNKFNLNEHNGDSSNELPLAATYIINTNGKIEYAFLDSDYRNRAEPEEITKFLKNMNK